MEKIWKDIEGYEGWYKISNYGEIISLDRFVNNRWGGKILIKGKIIKPIKKDDGHLQVVLNKNGIKKRLHMHQLVAQAFIPNPNNYEVVHHIDHNPENNRIDNLVWMSREEHTKLHSKLRVENVKKVLSKTVYQYTLNKDLIAVFQSGRQAARDNGFDNTGITKCANGEYKQYNGYIWSYIPL